MGGHQDGLALAVEITHNVEYLMAAGSVQITCRLVGQQYGRMVNERPGNRHPLLLTARQLPGMFLRLISEPQPL